MLNRFNYRHYIRKHFALILYHSQRESPFHSQRFAFLASANWCIRNVLVGGIWARLPLLRWKFCEVHTILVLNRTKNDKQLKLIGSFRSINGLENTRSVSQKDFFCCVRRFCFDFLCACSNFACWRRSINAITVLNYILRIQLITQTQLDAIS